MWGPALIVTFLYGLLAVFGFDGAREDAISATLSNAVPIVLVTAVAMVLSSFVLGVVTHTLARQLGGDGAWQPTVGLSMLIMSITDTPAWSSPCSSAATQPSSRPSAGPPG